MAERNVLYVTVVVLYSTVVTLHVTRANQPLTRWYRFARVILDSRSAFAAPAESTTILTK